MGLAWSDASVVKEGSLILCKSTMPRGQFGQELWAIWKNRKDELKEDGFGLARKGANWQILFWQDFSDDLMKKEGRTPKWRKVLDEKCDKWNNILRDLREGINEELNEKPKKKPAPKKVEEEEQEASEEEKPKKKPAPKKTTSKKTSKKEESEESAESAESEEEQEEEDEQEEKPKKKTPAKKTSKKEIVEEQDDELP